MSDVLPTALSEGERSLLCAIFEWCYRGRPKLRLEGTGGLEQSLPGWERYFESIPRARVTTELECYEVVPGWLLKAQFSGRNLEVEGALRCLMDRGLVNVRMGHFAKGGAWVLPDNRRLAVMVFHRLNEKADQGFELWLCVGIPETGCEWSTVERSAPSPTDKKWWSYVLTDEGLRTVDQLQHGAPLVLNELTDPQRAALKKMLLDNVFDRESRLTIAELARRIKARAETLKQPIADLKQRKLVDSRTGKGGGIWLTSNGKSLAAALLDR